MRATLYEQFRTVPELVTVPDPDCTATAVVIEVHATGLCRSDWHAWMGHDPDIRLPHVPGHEFAGTVTEVGRGVRRWRRGDRVTVPFVHACGECATCRRGEEQVCERQLQPGFTGWGSFAEAVAVERADVNLVRLPDGLDFDTAASLGCRFSTAYRAVLHHGRPAPGDWVVVHGCGGVGLSAVMIAAAHGARVIAVDISAAALDLAVEVGASAAINAADGDVVAAIRDLTGGGAEVSVDALGSAATCRNSIHCLRRRGRHVQVGLLVAEDAGPRIPMEVVIAGELEIIGSHGMAARAYAPMLDEILAGSLAPQRLISHRLDLSQAGAALAGHGDRPGDGITMIYPPGR